MLYSNGTAMETACSFPWRSIWNPPFSSDDLICSQRLLADSEMLGDVTGGTWNVFASACNFIGSLIRDTLGSATGYLECLYRCRGGDLPPGESVALRLRPLPKSKGFGVAYTESDGRETFSATSQLAALPFLKCKQVHLNGIGGSLAMRPSF